MGYPTGLLIVSKTEKNSDKSVSLQASSRQKLNGLGYHTNSLPPMSRFANAVVL